MAESDAGQTLAIVPARGGSKRIPRKNVRPFLGVPLIVRTLRTLLTAEVFDRVIVSTDDDEIARLAAETGAEVPFRRPDALADDHVATRPVIEHAIVTIEQQSGRRAGAVCCVYPAAVMVSAQMLQSGLQMLHVDDVDKVMTAVAFPAPIQRAWRRSEAGDAEMVRPEFAQTRTQDLEEYYYDAGQFYWAWRDGWLSGSPPDRVRMLEFERHRVIDIDTPQDWEAAELAYRILTEAQDDC